MALHIQALTVIPRGGKGPKKYKQIPQKHLYSHASGVNHGWGESLSLFGT